MGLLSLLTRPIETRISAENPHYSLSDPRIVDAFFGGGRKAAAGVTVSRQTVLGYPPIWRGVSLVSRNVGKVPTCVYKRRKEGKGRDQDSEHPAYWLLRRETSPGVSPMTFKATLTSHAMIEGNGYALIVRDGAGRPVELIILDPNATRRERRGGKVLYVTRLEDKKGKWGEVLIEPTNILHIRNLSYDGQTGYSILDVLQDALGLPLAIQKYTSVYYRNGARPSFVLKLPYNLKDNEAINRLRESWGNVHGGVENQHKPAILEGEGADIKELNFTNETSQTAELSEQQITQCANITGLSPHKLGGRVNTSYKSLEEENLQVLADCYDPWFVTWEQELELKLLTDTQQVRDSHVIEFTRQALIRTDVTTRGNFYKTMREIGVMNADIICDLENLDPLPDGLGEKYYIPSNWIEVGAEPPEAKPGEPAPESEVGPGNDDDTEVEPDSEDERNLKLAILQRQVPMIEQAIDRFKKRVAEHAERAARRPAKFNDWLEGYLTWDHREAFIGALEGPISTCLVVTRGATDVEVGVTAAFVDRWIGQVRHDLNELSGTVTAEELETRVTGYWANGVCANLTSELLSEVGYSG